MEIRDMTKVWLVWWETEGEKIVKVFSNEEKAKAFENVMDRNNNMCWSEEVIVDET